MSAPRYFSTTGHLLICQNSNCKARGSDLLYRAVWNALEQDKLAYYKTDGSVRLTESGCLGGCKSGPVMACYRTKDGKMEEAWYAAVDFPLARQVAQAIHDEAELPTDRRYGP